MPWQLTSSCVNEPSHKTLTQAPVKPRPLIISPMKVTKRDWLTIAAVVSVLLVLIMSTARDKGKRVPFDDRHRAFYEAVEKGSDRVDVERGCITCHNSQVIPLPKKHPPKEQCLICHMLNDTKQ
jgi:hypothetical protein